MACCGWGDDWDSDILIAHSVGSDAFGEHYLTDECQEEEGEGYMETEETLPQEISWTINVNELPQEIICDILEIASASAVNAASFAFRASLVCRSWKEIAWAAPKLWRRIDAETSLEAITRLLERSKQTPLDIRIYLNPMISESEGIAQIQSFVTLVSPERPRFRHFTFHYYYPSWFKAGSSLLTSGPSITVDSLDVRRLEYYNPSMKVRNTTVGANRITLIPRHLRYDDIRLPTTFIQVPMLSRSLKSLDLGWSKGYTPIDTFARMLSGAKNLEYLRLTALAFLVTPPNETHGNRRYLFPSLREMVLGNVSLLEIPSVYSIIETPALKCLVIDTMWGFRPDQAIIAIAASNPQLQRLHLSSCRFLSSLRWKAILSSLPDLTHLRLSNWGHNPIANNPLNCLIATRASPQSVLCPKLSSITFEAVEGVRKDFVVELVKSRRDVFKVSPIKALKWSLIIPSSASEVYEAIGTMVPNLVLECVDMAVLREPSESSEPSEEWLSDSDDLDLDSGTSE